MTEQLTIVFGIDDADEASRLNQVLGIPGRLVFSPYTMRGLRESGVDAFVMLSGWAHARYGGTPMEGVAQVLPTNGEVDSPPYVVTTPPRAMTIEDGSFEATGPALSTVDDYRRMLEAIALFNKRAGAQHIRRIGVHVGFLGGQDVDAAGESAALRDAMTEEPNP